MLMVFIAIGLEMNAVMDAVSKLRFYLAPLLLFLLGRNVAPLRTFRQVRVFVYCLSVLFILLGALYILLSRGVLLDLGLGDMLRAKLGHFGREDALFQGLPVNFSFYHKDGAVTERGIGPLFDPLATAFMGSVLMFYLVEIYQNRKRWFSLFLIIGVSIIVLLTLTRAIIIASIISLMLYRLNRSRMRRSTVYLVVVSTFVGLMYLLGVSNDLSSALDPSTVAHIQVYLSLDAKDLIFGAGIGEDDVLGSESLYLTILKDHGLLMFSIYMWWIVLLYLNVRKYFTQIFSYSTSASMFVLLLASFTTEHWFTFSSSALFWFLLGNNLSSMEMGRFVNLSRPV
jgi:hypothetical protein